MNPASQPRKRPRQVAKKRLATAVESHNKQKRMQSVHSANARLGAAARLSTRERNLRPVVYDRLKQKNLTELRALAERFGARNYPKLNKKKLLATLLENERRVANPERKP